MTRQVMKYNPAFLTTAELIDQFVVRHGDLETVLQTVRENTAEANQHVLVIGPRGSGKTMLVRRVAAEIGRDPALRERWYPLVFSEESYEVTTAGEFWLEAIFHLGQQTNDPRWQAKYEEYGRQWRDEDTLRERALGQLMSFAAEQGKRLLLIVENLNAVLGAQVSEDDAWKLRHTLLNEPRVMLLATATSRFEEIERGNKAMYELFRGHHLRPLGSDDCRVLWHALTGQLLEGERVRPIEILTGGNLRLLTILSTFAAGLSLHQFMDDLVSLVDEHTGYFKSHLDALPAVERKVYLALAELWDPSTAREVAAAARLDVSPTSSLLGRLVERGAVVALPGEKRTKCYQVAERMYNIYYLFRRRGSPSERVRAVVRFMISFYEPEQLVTVAHRIADEALTLEPPDRQDHYQVYCDLVGGISMDSFRDELVKLARDKFAKFDDVPAPLAQMIGPHAELPAAADKTARRGAENVSVLLQEALACLRESRVSEAERAFRKAIRIDPRCAPAWYGLGELLHEKLSRFDESEQAFRKAIAIDPRCAPAWCGLGELLHEKLSRPDDAERAYREAIAVDPQYARAWVQLGELLHEKFSRFDEAEQAYRKAVGINPEYTWAWAQLGELLHGELSRFDEAEQAYRRAIEINPRFDWAWVQLGRFLHEKLSRFDEAEQAYRKAIEIDPQSDLAWLQLGRLLHEKLSRFDEAEQAYRKAIEINPQFPRAWVQLGKLLHEKLSRFDEAEQAYRKAIEINPQYASAWALLGALLHEELSRFDEAEQAYRKAIEINPQYASASTAMFGLLFSRLERREEAVRFAESTIAQSPNDDRLLNECAWVLHEVGERPVLERALAWAREAVAMAPEKRFYHHTIASIQCALGNLEDALKSAEKYAADEKTIRDNLEDATRLFTELAARGEGQRALQVLLDSPSRGQLEPLVAGIRIFLGQEVNIATEIKEIGFDVARRIEQRRDALEAIQRGSATDLHETGRG